jgi:hypothetical protein
MVASVIGGGGTEPRERGTLLGQELIFLSLGRISGGTSTPREIRKQ